MPYNTTAIPPRKEITGQTQLPREYFPLQLYPAVTNSLLVTRVKKIIGVDPDITICSNNAAFVITLAAASPPVLLVKAPLTLPTRRCSFSTLPPRPRT